MRCFFQVFFFYTCFTIVMGAQQLPIHVAVSVLVELERVAASALLHSASAPSSSHALETFAPHTAQPTWPLSAKSTPG